MAKHTIKIQDGHLRFVYDDALAFLLDEGHPEIKRVSHVEPHPSKVGWVADMTPAATSPDLAVAIGANGTWFLTVPGVWELIEPFPTRQAALDAEREWLNIHYGL